MFLLVPACPGCPGQTAVKWLLLLLLLASANKQELSSVVDKKLLNLVANYEFLYKKDDKNYKNKAKMLVAWHQTELEITLKITQIYFAILSHLINKP